ncbi:hypothetical protein MBLNU459_g5975t1 [Dothideomycetes sp. NU459]
MKASQSSPISILESHSIINRRGYGDIEDWDSTQDDENDDEFPGVDIKTASGSTTSYVSPPATWDGSCAWIVDNSYKSTSRMHVANHSWSLGNFSTSNAGSRYSIRSDLVEHDIAYFNQSHVVVGSAGNLQLIQAAVPASSKEVKALGGEIKTAWADIQFGSVRTVARGTTNPGAGFFFYGSNKYAHETDIELRTNHTAQAAFSNQWFNYYAKSNNEETLTKLATLRNGGTISDWHKYRIDWLPNIVLFYIDGIYITNITQYAPVNVGQWVWNSWR